VSEASVVEAEVTDTGISESNRRELERVGAFSDGVFAIAITLLVLTIEVPDVPEDRLGTALSDLVQTLDAYLIGFAVMGLFWYGHHKLFSRLNRSSGRLVFVNMVFLASIALMPVTTDLLGRYDAALPVAVYAINVGVAALLDGLTELVAIRGDLIDREDARLRGIELPHQRVVAASTLARAAVFFLSVPLAYVASPQAAEWFWLSLVVVHEVIGVRRRMGLR
jgi:uncharacterized membrane protein